MWGKYCQLHFANGETEAQKEHRTKSQEWIWTQAWLQMSRLFPGLFFPHWLSECLFTGRESPSPAGLTPGSSMNWKCKAGCRNFRSRSLAIPKEEIVLWSSHIWQYFEILGISSHVFSHAFFLYRLGELTFDYECLGSGLWETIDTPTPQRYEAMQVLNNIKF